MTRTIYFLLGLVLAVVGMGVILKPRWYSSRFGYHFDLSELNIPIGIVLVLVGSIFIWSVLRNRNRMGTGGFLICPRCEAIYNKAEISEKTCPKCKVNLEELKGFYEKS